jgi:RecA/RadA recombinase
MIEEIISKYGEKVITSGTHLIQQPKKFIPVSPALDSILGGGIMEGCVVILTGNPKCGKTLTSLHFAGNAQKDGRKIFYLNVEGRLKARDIAGVKNLNSDEMQVIGSYGIDEEEEVEEEVEEEKKKGRKKKKKKKEPVSGKILCAEDYLGIAESLIRNVPRCVIILDSVGQLCSREEFDADVDEQKRAPVPVMLSRFTKKVSNILPVNNNILILITHLISNTGGGPAGFVEAGGRKIAYAVDIKLRARLVKKWTVGKDEDSEQIGQIITWETGSTALLPPGMKCDSYMRYGLGLDEILELINLGKEYGLIVAGSSGWTTATFMENHLDVLDVESWEEKGIKLCRVQGEEKFTKLMKDNPAWLDILRSEIGDM